MPMPRMRSGKSSESSSQVTGERKPCWKNRKVTVSERTTNGRISVPASRFADLARHDERTTAVTRHEPHAKNRGSNGDRAVGDVADQCGFRREAGLRQDLRAVIHDGVDARNLLADGDAHADELGDGHALIADLLEYLHRIADTALQQQPARALRHHEHAEPEHDSRDGCECEHVAPDVADLTEGDAEDSVEDEGEQLARDDHELILGDHAAAPVGRCHLCQVSRYRDRSTTDCQAEDEAAGDEDASRR